MLDFINKTSSRKFMALLVAVLFHAFRPQFFTGDHLVTVLIVYIGGNVLQKFAYKVLKK